jgi:hypothetical protein
MALMLSDDEGAVIYQGIQELLTGHGNSPHETFQAIFRDPSSRAGFSTFLCRYATDTCYCLTGGRSCPTCVRANLTAQMLSCFQPLSLQSLLCFLFRISQGAREQVAKFLTWSMRHPRFVLGVKERCGQMGLKEWEVIVEAVRGEFSKYAVDAEAIVNFFHRHEPLRSAAMTGIIQRAIGMHSTFPKKATRPTCFLSALFPRLIANTEPLTRADLILILFHLDRVFRQRIAAYVVQRGTFYCWNTGTGCQYASIQLDSFAD